MASLILTEDTTYVGTPEKQKTILGNLSLQHPPLIARDSKDGDVEQFHHFIDNGEKEDPDGVSGFRQASWLPDIVEFWLGITVDARWRMLGSCNLWL